jgi:hypothetical protein
MMELQEVQLVAQLFSFHSYDFPQYDQNVSFANNN